MTTFLPQNKFYPAPTVTIDARSAAATPCPHPLAAADALSVSPSPDPLISEHAKAAATDSCQEPVAVDDLMDDLAQLLGVKRPNLKPPRFAPDYEAIESAMHDPSAPRALETDPVWADEPPLFLRDRA